MIIFFFFTHAPFSNTKISPIRIDAVGNGVVLAGTNTANSPRYLMLIVYIIDMKIARINITLLCGANSLV
jgi:hypothetical protein